MDGLHFISIADDILIPRFGITVTDARVDHDRNFIALFERFEQHHVKINVMVESAVKTCQSLMKKALLSKADPAVPTFIRSP